MKGFEEYTSNAGFHVVRIHYSADPDRDPDTPIGAAWREAESKGIPGGINSAQWRREQEIDWNAGGGELVFPHFNLYQHKIVIAPFVIPETWSVYASYDYGHRNPCCFMCIAVDHDGNQYICWELYGSGMGYREQARRIRGSKKYGFSGCPYWDRLETLPLADPSIWAQTQNQQNEEETKSLAQLFYELPDEERIFFTPGKAGGDITVAEKIRGHLWSPEELAKGEQPILKIFANCDSTIREFRNLRYEDWSSAMMVNRNMRESIVDKNNHAWDAYKMFCTQFVMAPGVPQEDPLEKLKRIDPRSWAVWNADRIKYPELSGTRKNIMGEFD